MENNALITLITKNVVDGQEDSFELTTAGKYKKQNGKYFVSYEGSEISGYKDTTTTLKIQDDYVSMIRFGKDQTTTQMIFEENKKYTGIYRTPQGNLSIDVYTNEMSVQVDDDGGEVELDYFINLNNVSSVRNNLKVKIRKVEQE